MKILIVLFAIVGVSRLHQTEALKHKEAVARITAFNARLKTIEVPEEVKKLAEDIRSLNKGLCEHENLYHVITNEDYDVNLDVYGAGLVKEEADKKNLERVCLDFGSKVVSLMTELKYNELSMYLMTLQIELEKKNPKLKDIPDIDESLVYPMACFRFVNYEFQKREKKASP